MKNPWQASIQIGLKRFLGVCFLFIQLLSANAAEHSILFLPPPMDGSISLGIYDSRGKLVRILRNEAEIGDFNVALNGLIASWDGLDDAGAPCVPGHYRARGFMVGELAVEGIQFLGNDWVIDEKSPRIRRILDIAPLPDGALLLKALPPGSAGEKQYLVRSPDADADLEVAESLAFPERTLKVEVGEVLKKTASDWKRLEHKEFPEMAGAVDAAEGKDGNFWVLLENQVKKLDAKGSLLWKFDLPDTGGSFPAVRLTVSPDEELYFVLRQAKTIQDLTAFVPPDKAPKSRFLNRSEESLVVFSRGILESDSYEGFAGAGDGVLLPDNTRFTPAPSVKIALLPNPLFGNVPGAVELAIGFDSSGSFLKTADGLPLYKLSDTEHLLWAVLGGQPGSGTVHIFQSDGAVVEEFKAAHLLNMMAFDAGDVEIKEPQGAP